MDINKISDGQSKEGKQLLYAVTVIATVLAIGYYHLQWKISKIDLKEKQEKQAENILAHK